MELAPAWRLSQQVQFVSDLTFDPGAKLRGSFSSSAHERPRTVLLNALMIKAPFIRNREFLVYLRDRGCWRGSMT